MKIPYNVVHVSGNVLFAARGGRIHSFNLTDNTHLTSWKHPDVDKVDAAVKTNTNSDLASSEVPVSSVVVEGDEPPAKRQKVATDETVVDEQEEDKEGENVQVGGKKKSGKKSKNRQKNLDRPKEQYSKVPDRPVVTHLTSTSDGSHVLAITGHDKVIWVFSHDGNGTLTELSKRTMPKRPSSVTIGPDSQIISADKFGDVYALPLLIDESAQNPSSRSALAKPAFKPSANNTTVHSKRNLRALSDQQRQLELTTRAKADAAEAKPEVPDFELTLLLGHVSMLTSLVLGESEGRNYILTADRDEHIRISRYIPQAYVIEGYCFGHKEFVSSMTIPLAKQEVLISGGGDDHLFVWDWKAGKLLSQTNILSLAQKVFPELNKVAVSSLETLVYPTDNGNLTYILAICEDVSAIFSWQLTDDNILNHPAIIQLPGKPLSIALQPATSSTTPRIVCAMDTGSSTEARSLAIYSLTMTDEKLATETTSLVSDQSLEEDELDVDEGLVRSLLYGTGNLRKQRDQEAEQDDEEGQPESQDKMEVEVTGA